MKSDEGPPVLAGFSFLSVRSRKLCDLVLRIEMLRLPAQLALRLGAAQTLIARMASRPFAEFGGDRVRRNDFRLKRSRTKTLCEGACDLADRKCLDRRADIASARRRAPPPTGIAICEVGAMHQ